MILKYNRFALVPVCCCRCGDIFWLEGYFKHGGKFSDPYRICKRCLEKEDKK